MSENEPVVTDPAPVAETPVEQPAVAIEQPVAIEAPAPVEIKVEEDVEELKAKNKRYLEQMKGWKQKAEELEAAQITKALAPEVETPVQQTNEYEQEVVTPAPVQRNNLLDNLAILNAINYAKGSNEKKYRNDEIAPWNDDLESEVEKEVLKIDPRGTAKINPMAWDNAYQIVKGRKAAEQLFKERTKKVDELQKREVAKTVVSAQVTSASKPSEPTLKPTYEDVRTGKVKMTSSEMLKAFPDEILKSFLG